MTTMLEGDPLLRRRLSTYLQNTMPGLIDIARQQWNLTEEQLPYPVRYDAADPYYLGDYPVVGMYVTSDRDHVHRDIDSSSQREYWSLYSCRLFVAVITPKDSEGEYISTNCLEETVSLRGHMKAVLMNALLASPSLGGYDVEVLEESIATDYDNPWNPNDKLRNVFVTAAQINVDIRQTESLYLPAIGTVETTNVEVQVVPVTIGESL